MDGQKAKMSAGRRGLVYALLTLVVTISAWDIAADTEHWPFSNYPMYRDVPWRDSVVKYQFVGIHEGEEFEFNTRPYLEPWTRAGLTRTMRRVYRTKNKKQRRARMKEALKDLLALYERRRVSGKHDGPELSQLGWYKVSWKPDPDVPVMVPAAKRKLLAKVKP